MKWQTSLNIGNNQSAISKIESNEKAFIGHQQRLLFSIEVHHIKTIINNFNIIINS